MDVKTDNKRFLVALSFPGEHRPFVESVAEALAAKVGRHRVFYDRWYEGELARPNLDTHLQDIYHDQSELIAVFLCREYEQKEWCGLEWRGIRDLIKQKQDAAIMPIRFDKTQIPGLFSIDGYVSAENRSPDEIAALILQRLPKLALPPPEPKVPASADFQGIVSDSGSWLMLNNNCFAATSYREHGTGRISIQLKASDSEEDAALRALRPQRYQQPELMNFAYRNDGLLVRVQSVECESIAGNDLWTIELKPEPLEYGGGIFEDIATDGYTGEDIARLRGKRILLNDPPPLPDDLPVRTAEDHKKVFLDGLIEGLMTPLKIRRCPLEQLYPQYRHKPKQYLEMGRLVTIFALKAGFVVEHVTELSLGPLVGGKLHVRFRGRRRKIFTNKDATIFEIEGDCNLV